MAGGVHEDDFGYFSRYRGEGRTFIDIGANCGQSILSMRAVAPDTRIISFEPNPALFQQAQKVAKRLGNAIVHECGLGEAEQTLTLHIPRAGKLEFSQRASVAEPDRKALAADLSHAGFTFVTAENLSIKTVDVPIRRLDDFSYKPDVIKIDVEGFEINVLNGAVKTLQTHRPLLLIEGGLKEDISKFMSEMDYKPFNYSIYSPNTFFEPIIT